MPDTANKTKEESPGLPAPAGEVASKPVPRRPARAELVWDGKYDADGRRVAPLRVALPFQTIETVNESVQERQRGFLFESPAAYRAKEWRNRLIWGDKKYVRRYYEPDFVALTSDGTHYIVETKGLEDVNVANKDRAAQLWCENSSRLTGRPWAYLKVLQTEFNRLQPETFSDLSVLSGQQRPEFPPKVWN